MQPMAMKFSPDRVPSGGIMLAVTDKVSAGHWECKL
jgi:hypothetical protein